MKCFTDRVLFFFFFFIFYSIAGFSQFESQKSLYQFFPSVFNPAMVGKAEKIQIAGVQRVDFLGFASGVHSTDMTLNLPIIKGRSVHGFGLRFANKKTGSLYSNQNAYFQYAYNRKVLIGSLSVGIDVGFVNIGIAGTKVKVPELDDYHQIDDNKIPRTDVSGMGLDLNIGAAYFLEKFYLGASYAHINAPLVYIDENVKQRVPGILYLHAMYRYDILGTKTRIYPSTIFKTYFSNLDWDLGLRCVYDEKFWGGLSYRFLNALVFSAGLDVGYGVSAGLAYDLPTTRMIAGFGSLELFVQYAFDAVSKKQKNKYKTVRIL